MARGRFIVFEGIDGSGKSTTLARIAMGRQDTHATREETDGPLGEAVRDSIARRGDPLATTYLFLADRAEHVHEIRRHLEAGTHVLCDRYLHSTLAYQSVTLADRLPDPVAFLRALHAPIGLEPDHVLLFRADPSRCVARVQARGAATAYEKVAFLEQVQQAYLALAEGEPRIQVLDAERPLGDVVADARAIVDGWLA